MHIYCVCALGGAAGETGSMYMYCVCALVGAVWMVAWLHVALELAGMLHAA